ncbi:amino acid transporter AVT1I-like [Malania oleifera]|uniref:amino acid transporter AVT1I-like n=1 Tax=Malania oleifera TaxID=397392 RepID=UPI0025ADCA95|nr:amino acid transporter AVT1I-like [Malania oleifera]
MEEQLPHSTSGSKGTTFLKTCFNGFNALCGVGIITLPYTLAQGGWITLVLLLGVALTTCYTALLLQRCMDSDSSIKTYPDVGWHAFGRKGRIIVSIFIYSAAYLVSTGFLILESDNLHKLFPNAGFKLGEYNIRGKQLSTILAGLAILPTMWLKDLSKLSFISAGGNVAIVIIISSILWVGVVDSVGFSAKGELFRLGGIPTALSLYAFSYGGHEVFPTIYSSMKDKTRFSEVYN